MIIRSLFLTNYRNLDKLSLKFSPKGLLIYGKNGCGKTNLLEAISYFSFGKSFKNISDTDVLQFGKDNFFLEANFTVSNYSEHIKIKVNKNKKIIYANGNLLKKITELYKYIKVVYFSPSDIDIINGYPMIRRRFFDIAISQYDYKYLEYLRIYNRILKQRNALLKSEFLLSEKNAWDKKFIEISKKIILQRLSYLKLLKGKINYYYKQITKGKEFINIKYIPKFEEDENEIEKSLKKRLNEKTEDEKNYQRTLFGPHLHEFSFEMNNRLIKKFGSQGQKRSFVIALRLAQAKLIDLSYNDPPILIFDDVLSDLDTERAKNIFDLIEEKHQIFIATPNKRVYSPLQIESFNLEEYIQQNENK